MLFIRQSFLSPLEKILNEKLGQNLFTISFITVHQMQIVIRKLDSNKAVGLNWLGPRILKQCGNIMTPAITSITCINNSIAPWIIP